MKRQGKFRLLFFFTVLILTVASVLFTACAENAPSEGKAPDQVSEKGDDQEPVDEEAQARIATLKADQAAGFFILVNKTHPLAAEDKPEDLEQVKYYAADRSAAGRYMRKEAADQFNLLVETAASEKNLEFKTTTAYRSYEFQKTLYDQYVAKDGEEAANRYSAKPGESEHQTGLTTDVSSPSVNYRLTVDYENTPEGQWLAENAHRFGFIIRYPKGKEDVTGYQYEPWHIRYVGKTAAAEIYEQQTTLEEYLESLSIE